MRTTVVLTAALLAGAPVAVAVAEEIVVLESSAARYSAGQVLDAAAPLALAPNESVTVVTEDARLIKIEGPHDGPATGPAPDQSAVRRALAQLIAEGTPAVGGIGGVRAGELEELGPDTRPDPWLLHAERSGNQCVLRGESVVMWREGARESVAAELRVSLAESGERILWSAGEQRSAWPATTALVDDTVYLLRTDTSLRSIPIRLHLLAPALAGRGLATAAWLAGKGCIDQARLLLRESAG